MHVLHVISSIDPTSGGPAQALLGLATAQKHAGMHVEVLTSIGKRTNLANVEQLQQAGVRVLTIGPRQRMLRFSRGIASRVDEAVAAATVVHIHALWEQIQHESALASRRHGKPHIFRPCGMLDPWSLSQSWLKKRLYMEWRLRHNLNNATLLHFTSQTERDLTAPLRLTTQGVVEVNGINLEEFESMPEPGSFRVHYPSLRGRPMVLFLSRLHRKKGLELLIPAFAQLRESDAMLVIAGPDDRGYRAQVEAMVQRENLCERVILTGMITGDVKRAALADADVFVLPSYQENFGIAVVEALAAGTPVIISDQVNIHHVITSEGVGAVVPTDIKPLSEAMARMLADHEGRAQAAAKARPFVKRHYDWIEIARRWSERYAALAEGRMPADIMSAPDREAHLRRPA